MQFLIVFTPTSNSLELIKKIVNLECQILEKMSVVQEDPSKTFNFLQDKETVIFLLKKCLSFFSNFFENMTSKLAADCVSYILKFAVNESPENFITFFLCLMEKNGLLKNLIISRKLKQQALFENFKKKNAWLIHLFEETNPTVKNIYLNKYFREVIWKTWRCLDLPKCTIKFMNRRCEHNCIKIQLCFQECKITCGDQYCDDCFIEKFLKFLYPWKETYGGFVSLTLTKQKCEIMRMVIELNLDIVSVKIPDSTFTKKEFEKGKVDEDIARKCYLPLFGEFRRYRTNQVGIESYLKEGCIFDECNAKYDAIVFPNVIKSKYPKLYEIFSDKRDFMSAKYFKHDILKFWKILSVPNIQAQGVCPKGELFDISNCQRLASKIKGRKENDDSYLRDSEKEAIILNVAEKGLEITSYKHIFAQFFVDKSRCEFEQLSKCWHVENSSYEDYKDMWICSRAKEKLDNFMKTI